MKLFIVRIDLKYDIPYIPSYKYMYSSLDPIVKVCLIVFEDFLMPF